MLLEHRLARLRRLGLDPVPEPPGEHEVETALAPIDVRDRVLGVHDLAWLDPGAFWTAAAEKPPPPAAREHELVRARTVLVARASWLVHGSPRTTPPATLVDRAETDLRWCAQLTWTLVDSELATIARTIRAQQRSDGDAVRAALGAAIDATERFSGTGRLAAAVTLAGTRALAARPTPVPRVRLARWEFLFPDARLARGIERLDPPEREVAHRYFAITRGAARSADELGGARCVVRIARDAARRARVA